MFSSISQSPSKDSWRAATLCSAAVHAAVLAALWATGQAITAPPIPRHEPREAVLLVSPPPRLFRPRPQPKAAVQRFEMRQTASTRTAETIRAAPEAPKIAAHAEPAPSLPQQQAIVVTKPVGFAEIARVAPPNLELESRAEAFGSVQGKREPSSVLPSSGSTGFGAVGLAKTQSPIAATSGGGFGGAEVGRAARRADTTGEAGFGAAERRLTAAAVSEPTSARSKNRPVKILWKPVPKYSEEGLQRRIEGDVVLLVRFRAQGTVETLQVVSGLGYGLDEYALQAAEAMRFEPATEGDQPVDYTAQVRIRFELAY